MTTTKEHSALNDDEDSPSFITPNEEGVILRVLIQPRASKDEITGTQDGRLKIRLKAAPVEGVANKALVGYIAKLFGIKKAGITITTGLASRRKTVRIEGFAKKEALERLEGYA